MLVPCGSPRQGQLWGPGTGIQEAAAEWRRDNGGELRRTYGIGAQLRGSRRILEQSAWGPASVGGPSGPMLLCLIAAIRPESVGPEGPPTKARA
ncbi:DUF6053 domain-containing protein [Lysobacter enzymogenes]|uniref:DUF6053 domain-containing protein n=1 Tax=Lysobacter enzymogenes TaxID=69 RepID=UPI003D187BD5